MRPKHLRVSRDQEWWQDRYNLCSLIDWADEVGEFSSVAQVRHFVEKPWLYEDLWLQMRESVS